MLLLFIQPALQCELRVCTRIYECKRSSFVPARSPGCAPATRRPGSTKALVCLPTRIYIVNGVLFVRRDLTWRDGMRSRSYAASPSLARQHRFSSLNPILLVHNAQGTTHLPIFSFLLPRLLHGASVSKCARVFTF